MKYYGDINGNFFFKDQVLTSGERFGVTKIPPKTVDYFTSNLTDVENGIEKCLDILGKNTKHLDTFFKNYPKNWNIIDLARWFRQYHISMDDLTLVELLKTYFELHLGQQIAEQIRETGMCGYTVVQD